MNPSRIEMLKKLLIFVFIFNSILHAEPIADETFEEVMGYSWKEEGKELSTCFDMVCNKPRKLNSAEYKFVQCVGNIYNEITEKCALTSPKYRPTFLFFMVMIYQIGCDYIRKNHTPSVEVLFNICGELIADVSKNAFEDPGKFSLSPEEIDEIKKILGEEDTENFLRLIQSEKVDDVR